MDHLPLTRSGTFEEFPATAGMDVLFPELASPGSRPVEVTVTVPAGDSRRCVMQVVTGERNAELAFGIAFGACRNMPGYELTVRAPTDGIA
jgi:hypothetical protein